MMRITETSRNRRSVALRVEGWISGEDSRLLETQCTAILETGREIRLDCSMVTFVDGTGTAVLRRLLLRQLTIVRCPPFILDFVNPEAHTGTTELTSTRQINPKRR